MKPYSIEGKKNWRYCNCPSCDSADLRSKKVVRNEVKKEIKKQMKEFER
jgi:hypothetical protein